MTNAYAWKAGSSFVYLGKRKSLTLQFKMEGVPTVIGCVRGLTPMLKG